MLDRELAEGVPSGPRRCRRRLYDRLRVDRGRFDDVSTESPLLFAGGLELRQSFLAFLDSGRLRRLGLSVGGLAARVFFEAPPLDLRGSRGLLPRVFEAPLFFEAALLDLCGLVTQGVDETLMLLLSHGAIARGPLVLQERHGELEPGPAEGDVHGRNHARRRR